jgi:HlyD family secretion protein
MGHLDAHPQAELNSPELSDTIANRVVPGGRGQWGSGSGCEFVCDNSIPSSKSTDVGEKVARMLEERTSPTPHLAGIPPDGADEQLRERVRSLRLPRQNTAGSATGRWFPWVLCLALAGSTAALGYLRYTEGQKPALPDANTPVTANTPPKSSPIAAAPAASSGGFALESKGYIIPAHQILISPKVNGMVVKLRITESQRVAKGDVLAELEDTEFRADRDRAKAMLDSARQNLDELKRGFRPEEIDQARAELAEAEAQRVQYEADFKRAAELLAKKVLSREAYDSTLSKFQAMDRRVQRLNLALKLMVEGPRIERIKSASAQVNQAGAELAKAEWRLNNCIIRAPISGTILKKNAEEGSLVNPIAMQGFYSLCEMADLSDLEVDLTIQERDISKVFADQKCQVRAEAFPDRVYQGYVSRLMPTADRAKGAIPVRVKVKVPANEEGVYLKPEMGALVSFLKK